jgi:predicted MFS family arabinose efflux permease
MSILAALGGASALLFSLFAGVIVDRVPRRPVLIGADIGRAVLLGTIPLAAILHWLNYWQLVIVAALTGILTVLFDVAYQSYLPSLVKQESLAQGNRILGMGSATAEILGPGLTGILVTAISAPLAIAIDAASFLVSSASVMAIRGRETLRAPSVQSHWLEEALAGAQVIRKRPLLRALALRTMTAFLCMGSAFSFYIFYAVRDLGMSRIALGFTIALGGVGALLGAWLAERVSKRLGSGRAFFGATIFMGFAYLLIPAAGLYPSHAIWFLGSQQLFGDFAWALYAVNEIVLRQRVTPPELLGRVNAAMQIASRGMLPLGALIAGVLTSFISVQSAMWIGAVGILLSGLWLWPVRNE